MKRANSVLFLGKKNDPQCEVACNFLRANFKDVCALFGAWGEPLPDEPCQNWRGDYVVSYLSRWIVPDWLLSAASVAAINFHPGSPDYPGIGCINFALYDGAKEYGATCHFMEPKVDTGAIIATKRLPVFESDDVGSLLLRTYANQIILFYEIAAKMICGERLIPSGETWGRPAYTRKEFDELGKVELGMSCEEVLRRIRATKYLHWGPTVEVGGFTFRLDS